MSPPTVGITILVIINVLIMGQLLILRFEQRKRHRELREELDRISARLGK